MAQVLNNSIQEAFVKSGFLKEVETTQVDHTKEAVKSVSDYVASVEDIELFNSFNPASNLSLRDKLPLDMVITLVEIPSYALFSNLGYNFEMENPPEGIFVSSGNSYLTLAAFNFLYARALKYFNKVSISFTWKNPILMKKKFSLNILDGEQRR